MKVAQVTEALERIAPPQLAEDWDNVGLLVGDADAEVKKLLLCVDLTADVLAEAARVKAQMVLAYHPVIFKGLKRLTAQSAPVAYVAAQRGLAVYSPHTALDAAPGGTNDVLAEALGLGATRPIEPTVRRRQCKIVTFVSPDDMSAVAEAAFSAGAGRVGNYYDCAFFSHGIGAFCGETGTQPAIGAAGRHEVTEELRLEVVAPRSRATAVAEAIRAVHSYEQPVVDIYPLDDRPAGAGMGRIGRLHKPVTSRTLINRIKDATGLKNVSVARAARRDKKVATAAVCAGSCGSIFRSAMAEGAEFYLTGEMRHHDALAAAAGGMTVAAVGHSNSERLTLPRLAERVKKELKDLSTAVSKRDRDPFEIV